ncbi:MAG: c-type cytochrome [Burkholderiaceae bacterium]|nr:c-type cytochrome [Burkholderiaceae bacterium]
MMRPITAAAVLAALAFGAPVPALANPTEAMTKAGCLACHSMDKKLVGPSYKDVAAKYKGQDVVVKLMQKVRSGGKDVFGPVPMPPTGPDKISDSDLKAAIEYILKG